MVKELAPENSQELQITQSHSKTNNANEEISIVITSFEPFSETEMENPVWQSIMDMPNQGVAYYKERIPVKFYCYELRNIYDFIAKQIKRCWEKHAPDIVIILGQHLSGNVNELHFEQCSSNTYVLNDKNYRLPSKTCCTNFGAPTVKTQFDLRALENQLRVADTGVVGKVKETIGGFFLCDYAYYNSLFIDPARTVCIRLPQERGLTPKNIMDSLSLCIQDLLQQLEMKQLL